MTSPHDLGAAFRGKLHPLPGAREHLLHIADAAKSVLELVRREPRDKATAVDIDAIGALLVDWAAQLAILVDGDQRIAAQYVRRLAELLREQAKSTDCLRIEVLAWGILRAVEYIGDPSNDKCA